MITGLVSLPKLSSKVQQSTAASTISFGILQPQDLISRFPKTVFRWGCSLSAGHVWPAVAESQTPEPRRPDTFDTGRRSEMYGYRTCHGRYGVSLDPLHEKPVRMIHNGGNNWKFSHCFSFRIICYLAVVNHQSTCNLQDLLGQAICTCT